MNGVARLAVLGGLFVLAAGVPAEGQVFRMGSSTGTLWVSNLPPVACTAHDGFVRRASHTTSWRLNTGGQGSGKFPAIQGALDEWTNVTNADFVLNYGGTTTGTFKQTDGVNSLSWGIDGVCDAKSCHALTALRLGPGQQILESDILFNDNPALGYQWMINGQYTPGCEETVNSFGLILDTQGIATHELGHALGIQHPTNSQNTTATMGNLACRTGARSLEEDDRLALRCSEDRYPENPNYQGAVHTVTCAAIKGWAWNANKGYERSYVEIAEVNGVIHGVPHADLPGAPVGDGNHEFSFTPAANSSLRNGNWHSVRARYSGNQANVSAPVQLICARPLFSTNLDPSDPPLSTGGISYTVGTKFKSDVAGKITHLSYYFSLGEVDVPDHTARLWSEGGTLLASVDIDPVVGGDDTGWSHAKLSSPYAIQANTNYIVSIDTYQFQSKSSCGSPGSLQNPYVNSPLTALQGLWRTGVGAQNPPNTGSCSNFFVGVKFDM